MSGIQTSGIVMQPADISNRIYHSVKLFQKESCSKHVQPPLAPLALVLPHTVAITFIVSCEYSRG
jgi:hypothetical protein